MTLATTPRSAQPAKGILATRRITIRRAAVTIGMSEVVLGRILNRIEPPTPRIRAGLSALLGLPESDLFDDLTSDRRAR